MTTFDKTLQLLKDADADDILDLRIIQQRVVAAFEALSTTPARAEAQDEGAETDLIERLLEMHKLALAVWQADRDPSMGRTLALMELGDKAERLSETLAQAMIYASYSSNPQAFGALSKARLSEDGASPMTAPSNANTSGLGDVGLSETYRFAYESIRNGAPGLSDATCAAIARSINMKVSLAANDRATAAEARADRLAKALKETRNRVREWPIGDHETCMCGSPVASHGMGDGHSPVSQGDHAISMIVEAINEALAALKSEGKS